MRQQPEARAPAVVHQLRVAGRGAGDQTVYVVHPGALPVRTYQRLADALPDDAGLTVLDLGAIPEYRDMAIDGDRADVCVENLADQLEVQLNLVQDGRPWSLLGWSFGGVVGHELVSALSPARRPRRVVLLDSIAPVGGYKHSGAEFPIGRLLTWFGMYLGAKRGHPVVLPVDRLADCDLETGLDLLLATATDCGALLPGTPKAGLRKLFETYVHGLSNNQRLVEPYQPEPASWPLTVVTPEHGLLAEDPTLGWDQLAVAGLRTHRCDGDHYAMLTNPGAVTLVAGLLDPRPTRTSPTERVAVNAQPDTDLDRRLARDPIAIVGLSALYPQSGDLREFWRNVVEGTDCITDVPDGHWKLADHYDPDPSAPDKTYCRRGGFIPPVAFNPLEFGLPPNALEVTDVLQLLSLVVARDVLADAGADGGWYDAGRTGVVLGVTGANQLTQPLAARLQTPLLKEVVRSCGLSPRDAEEIAEKFKLALAPWEENSFPGMLGNVVAGRIANRLDLGGTNATVDAACASSLAAAKLAVSELLERRADTMITGGCDAENTILMYLCFSKTPAFSKAGVIRPFDAEADGTLIGEGIGMLALRRLADAERDGNRIYAVIRGIGSSSDGRFKSIYAPREEGQITALRRAYADADCSPESVELFEAHGTGTAVGDATELSALATVVGPATERFAAVGSVKSQIGHTKAAAGAAGMIKLALALHGRLLPPTINVGTPSPAVAFEGSPFYVNTKARPWVRDPNRPQRRAATSSFGFGGTNFHFVLEEHGDDQTRLFPAARPYLWHAPDPAALAALLEDGTEPAAGPVPTGHARIGFAARTAEQLATLRALAAREVRARPDAEAWSHPKGVHYRRQAIPGLGAETRVGALFAGQGSQYVGLGSTAVMALPPLLDAFDRANAHFTGVETLSRVAFPPPAFDDATRQAQELALRRTEYAQPAIGALAAGQFRYLSELGFVADGFLGHSFGELTALWAAGSLDDDTFMALARARGAAMAPPADTATDPGAMAAVNATEEQVDTLLAAGPGVRVCNRNGPNQIVVGGGTAAVEALISAAAAIGIRATRLPVSAAFHTPFVAHASEAFGAAVRTAEVRPPERPVYADTPGASYGADLAANRQVLTDQLVRPVHFADRVEEMYADGFRVFVEFGPGGVLTRLLAGILGDRAHICVQLDPGAGRDADLSLREGIAQLAVAGLPLSRTDRYAVPVPVAQPAKGMTVQLTGINYVSEDRRAAYQDAIANGYRVSPPAVDAPPIESRSTTPEVETVRSEQQPHDAPGTSSLPEIAAAHLALHDEYLTGQLRTAERLSGLLAKASAQREPDGFAAAITSVTDHGLAISRTHQRVNEVLREMAQLELGAVQPARPAIEAAVAVPADDHATTIEAAVPAAPSVDLTGLRAVLLQVVAAKTGYPAEMLEPEMDVEADLGIDSIKRVEIMGELQERFPGGAQAGPERLAELRTLGDIIAFLADTNSSGEPPSVPVAAPSPTPDLVDLRAVLLDVVAAKTGYPAEMLEFEMDVEADLGIDSIKRVEIMGELQERFPAGAQAGPERLAELRTLGDIIAFLADTPAEVPAADLADIGRAQAALSELPMPDQVVGGYRPGAGVLIVDDGSDLVPALVGAFGVGGWNVTALRLADAQTRDLGVPTRELSGWAEAELTAQVDAILATGSISACITVAADIGLDWSAAVRRLSHTLLVAKTVIAPLTSAATDGRAAFLTLTRLGGRFGLNGVAADQIPYGGVAGLVKTMAAEAPEIFCRAVDVFSGLPPAEVARLVLAELSDTAAGLVQVGHDGIDRLALTLDTAPTGSQEDAVPPLTAGDLLVVTGGGRGITATCVTELARTYGCGLVLLGRTPLTAEPGWARDLSGAGPLKAAAAAHLRDHGEQPTPKQVERLYQEVVGAREVQATLAAVRAAGATVSYEAVDITDRAATAAALAPYAGQVTGLVHGAGVLADQLIAKKSGSDIDRVFAPKLTGLRSVLAALATDELRHIVLFSSVAGFFGNPGQSDYAMANEVLNTWASAWKRSHPRARVTALNWGAWDSGMVSPSVQRRFQERGVTLIPAPTGARLFCDQFDAAHAGDTVTVLGPTTPLSEPSRPRSAGPVVLERDLAALGTDPVVTDHMIGGVPVLPATVALGWAVAAVERVSGGVVHEVRDFTVHRGVLFDGTDQQRCQLEARPADGDATAVAIRSLDSHGTTRPRYAATVVTAPPPTAAAVPDLPRPGTGDDAAGLYLDGTLFHGPALRGVRRILAATDSRLVLECALPAFRPAGGAFDGQMFAPVTADLLLQAALVWVRRVHSVAGLPTAVARIELYEPLPDGGTFLVVVEPAAAGPAGAGTTLDVTACAPDGRVLARFTGVSIVSTPQLTAKFLTGATA